ncbi:hypothetical protein SAMN05444390_103146 [Marinobacterium lutimaris]|uniref:Uncharacterized protein n=1 Tax=Marinobacterium lutimaris TaxID=568106 RepID=A0A1H6C3P3_9GAMM|nr:hypothetical protein SAMN05444390_103146 [Marinobacterium lutimaris]
MLAECATYIAYFDAYALGEGLSLSGESEGCMRIDAQAEQ